MKTYRILSVHILLEGVDGKQSVLSAVIIVVTVVDEEEVDVMLQLHVRGNNELDNIGEELRNIHSLGQLLHIRN